MSEDMMTVCLGVVLVAWVLFAVRLERNSTQLRHDIAIGIERLSSKTLPDFPDIDELRDEIEDIIAQTIGSMRTPQIADHLGAILSNWAQVKMAKEMQSINEGNLLNSILEDDVS